MNLKKAFTHYFPLAIIVLTILFFFKGIWSGPLHSLTVLDNYIAFFNQFQYNWLNTDSFFQKLHFFISKSNWPHPKLICRILTVSSYYITGNINLGYFSLIGNIGMLFTCFTVYLVGNFKQKILYILPILFILLQVTRLNFWTIAIVGYGFNLMSVILSLYYLTQRKYLQTSILLFFVFFTSGAGFLISIPVFFILLLLYIDNEINKKEFLCLISLCAIYFFIFYFFTLDGAFFHSQKSISGLVGSNEVGFITKIISKIIYATQVLGQVATSEHSFLGKNVYINFILGLIGFSLMGFFTLKSRTLSKEVYPFLGGALYFLILCCLAGLMRDQGGQLFENTLPRYLFQSIFFWVCIYILAVLKWYKDSFFVYVFGGIVLFTFLSFISNSIGNHHRMPYLSEKTQKSLFNNIAGDYYSFPQIRHKLSKDILTNNAYTKAFNKNLTPPKDRIFTKILAPSLTVQEEKIDSNRSSPIKIRYNFFRKNGLLKIIGSSNTLTDALVVKIPSKRGNELFKIQNLKRKGKRYFFELFILDDFPPESNFSFLVLEDSSKKYHKTKSVLDFNQSLYKDKHLSKYSSNDKKKAIEIEKSFYEALTAEKYNMKKVGKLLTKRNKKLARLRKNK